MSGNLSKLARFGGKPKFGHPLPVGQINLPHWEEFVEEFEGIFQRKYYTNYGPLERKLEDRLKEMLSVEHVIPMTNATIGLSIAALAMNLPKGGKVIVPAFTFAATVQALTWAGLEPVFCEVDPATHSITTDTVEPHVRKKGVKAILGVHLWGNACDIDNIEVLADRHGLKVFYDAAHAIGCSHSKRPIGNFGACEVFSMHGTKVLNSAEGGFVTTNDSQLAETIRHIRSSYGHREKLKVDISANGRFSEAQAAMGLLGLKHFESYCAANWHRYQLYQQRLSCVPGINIFSLNEQEKHNYQYVVIEVEEEIFGLNRDQLVSLLEFENIMARRYFTPGLHRVNPFKEDNPEYTNSLPSTDDLCKKVMQLPSGQSITDQNIQDVCNVIKYIHENSGIIKMRL